MSRKCLLFECHQVTVVYATNVRKLLAWADLGDGALEHRLCVASWVQNLGCAGWSGLQGLVVHTQPTGIRAFSAAHKNTEG